jgi:16S rRNA (uracil1498-N3)-methyltransferase
VHRFTIAPERLQGDRVTFDRDETRHLARVLRLVPGDVVLATDGAGHEFRVRVEALGVEASGTVLASAVRSVESSLAVTLLQGVPKGDKMETIVRACTELGVARIRPVLTERTIVRLEPSRWRERARRWQRVAREAAKQCGRAVVPDVDVPVPLAQALDGDHGDLGLCLWEAAIVSLAETLDARAAPPRSLTVVVGPEGGLARAEVDAARARGFAVIGLGPRILRTETAAPALVAVVQSRYGDLAARGAVAPDAS